MEGLLRELETAAQILLADPNIVTMDTRHAAEAVFMNFRQTKQPYLMCKQILDTSRVDYVLFEAAGLLKTALIKEWSFLQDVDKTSLKDYLLNYVIERSALAPFVRERMLQVISIMIKRESVDDMGASRKHLLDQVENLILNGDPSRQTLGCNLIAALMQEYAITVKSSDVGLTWETHFKAKKMFEVTDLKRIFQFCCRALGSLVLNNDSFNQQTAGLLKSLQSLSETVLTWTFIQSCFPKRMVGIFEAICETEQQSSLKFPSNWSDVVKDPQVVNLFFTVYWKIRMNPQLFHHALTCLVQLASLNGNSFETEEIRLQYINNYLQAFVKLVSSAEILDREALGISNIIYKILLFFPPGLLVKLPCELMQAFLDNFAKLTCNFSEGAAAEESVCGEDRLYMEGFDRMMEAWLLLLVGSTTVPENLQKAVSRQILDVYLKCHLAPPSGTRGTGRELDPEELDEQDEPDRIRFFTQLSALGHMVRIVPEYGLPLLSDLIEDRTRTLSNALDGLRQQSMTIAVNSALIVLFEDINWLLLISGYVITMHGDGEIQSIPNELVRYSVKTGQTANKDISLKMFGSPHEDVCSDKTQADPLLRLVSAVFRLAHVIHNSLVANMVQFLSPEVSSSLLWFLQRWSEVYLLLDEELYQEISFIHLSAHGRDSEGAIWAFNFLFTHVNSHLQYFQSETAVCQDAVNLLLSLVQNTDKRNCFLNSSGLNQLLELLPQLPTSLKRGIYTSFAKAGINICNEHNHDFWVKVFENLQNRFKVAFSNKEQSDSNKAELLDVFECCTGIAHGVQSSTVQVLFNHMYPILNAVPKVLDVYHNYTTIVESILTLLCETSLSVVPYLVRSETRRFFDICLRIIGTYAKWNNGRLSLETGAQDDTFQDVFLLVELLINLLRKDYLDLGAYRETSNNEGLHYTATDVCLCGLQIIMPLMSQDLLKYPALCKNYFRFLEYVSDSFPEKLLALPYDLLKNILTSIELGLTTFGQEIIVYCCDFLQYLAWHIASLRPMDERPNPVLKPFVKLLLNLILSHQMNMDATTNASAALFALICCYKEEYQEFVSELVTSADENIRERLMGAFHELTANLSLNKERPNRLKFRNNFDKFIVEVHGFLNVK